MVGIKTLFCEDKKNLSLGRVGLWLVLIPALKIWWLGTDIKENHLYVLGFFLIYNSYKKMPMIINLVKAWRGNDE